MKLESYQTLIFDCDGVVLNSNQVKTRAFYEAALPYGELAAQALVDYHRANGGISRYRKFEYFLERIVEPGATGPSLDQLLAAFAERVRGLLGECEIADGLFELREKTADARWLLVSGGDQEELRDLFATRGIARLFDGGIFGSPDSKDEILARALERDNILSPALFIGDSRYDHEAAARAGLDFVFLTQWSEFSGYQTYFRNLDVIFCSNLKEMMG